MPLFRRRPPEFSTPIGTLPCSEHGCAKQTAITCAYHDLRGRTCGMAFCPEHWQSVGGVIYCRRHAGTITALGATSRDGPLPDLDNRGPSLVNWIAEDISAGVAELLERVARVGETVQTDTKVTAIFDQNRHKRWERSWKLIENTGVSLKVGVEVSDDTDDALIDARVGSYIVARGVPPWVARRRAGLDVDGAADDDQRELFRRFFIEHIAAEIAEQRATDGIHGPR